MWGAIIDTIRTRNATIGVLGLGYVGLPLSVHFESVGFDVIGYDIDSNRVQKLQDGRSYVEDIDDERLHRSVSGGFFPTSDESDLDNADVFIVAVPTGLNNNEPDMSAVRSAMKTVGRNAREGPILVICCSTLYPGATSEVIEPQLIEEGRSIGSDTYLAMVPERLSPGGELILEDIPVVVGANDERARKATQTLFETIITETIPVETILEAEMAKLVENAYRQVNIGLVNELAVFAKEVGVDIWNVLDAAETKPSGFQKFEPGPGVGGHCIPVDPMFLSWKAKEFNRSIGLIERAQQINNNMPQHVLENVETVLAIREKELSEANIAVFGLTYKPNVGDVRNSPAVDVCKKLVEADSAVSIVDPHVSEIRINDTDFRPVDHLDSRALRDFDLTLLLVDHDQFDLRQIARASQIVFDAKNAVPEDVETPVVRLGTANITKEALSIAGSKSYGHKP